MDRKFFIVANPYSGEGKAQAALMRLKKRLDQLDFYYAVFITPQSEILDEFIEENLFTDTTDLVVIGGDGTINASLNAIRKYPMVMSFIPVGTGNDFVKTIDIGSDLDEQIETIIHGRERLIDVGICNKRKFINGIGIGFDGQMVYENLHTTSIFSGHLKFYMHVLKILWTYRSKYYVVNMDGQRLEMKLILMAVQNGTTFGGGFKLNPDAKIDDGLLNICTIGRMTSFRRFLNIGRLNFGKHGKLPEVNFFQAKELRVEPNDMLLAHLDGEYIGSPPFNISISEKFLRIRVKS
ncbi:diacylglycerol/lipid kinase family protein [Reichenbachiella agariperforans]|uniref:diacylglycerol/lipid kinase family protein n=1 Tax=Reichenbachiella agariperforans TaxID=156994 RepID=UPI001C09276E|nr:diacylglycerol kinase family protein [Reichenbachiella agariperforans]MBU2914917.1 diacylglycerol kinase family lipid kinase [Reichenbachiella agariperforans]